MTPDLYDNWTQRLSNLQNKTANALLSPVMSRPAMSLDRSASEFVSVGPTQVLRAEASPLQTSMSPRRHLSHLPAPPNGLVRSSTEPRIGATNNNLVDQGLGLQAPPLECRPRLRVSLGPSNRSFRASFDASSPVTLNSLAYANRRNSLGSNLKTACGMDWTPSCGLRIEQMAC